LTDDGADDISDLITDREAEHRWLGLHVFNDDRFGSRVVDVKLDTVAARLKIKGRGLPDQ